MGLKRKLMEFFGDDIEDDEDELSEELSNDEKRSDSRTAATKSAV
ncbi:hypothetical protein AB8B23_10600 [Leptotrichia sp. HSP-342]|uniref:Cell division protein SepF n=1 Tax=Leptotrichia mesophila TaxID=3239303 RepID=A0AB39VAX3_9FUSO